MRPAENLRRINQRAQTFDIVIGTSSAASAVHNNDTESTSQDIQEPNNNGPSHALAKQSRGGDQGSGDTSPYLSSAFDVRL